MVEGVLGSIGTEPYEAWYVKAIPGDVIVMNNQHLEMYRCIMRKGIDEGFCRETIVSCGSVSSAAKFLHAVVVGISELC